MSVTSENEAPVVRTQHFVRSQRPAAVPVKPGAQLRSKVPAPVKRAWSELRRQLYSRQGLPVPGTLINEGELRPQFRRALEMLIETEGADNVGDYLEFGVYKGTSLRLMYEELNRAKMKHVRMFGFDSFQGLPFDEEEEWQQGSYRVDDSYVISLLNGSGVNRDRVSLIRGFYHETLTPDLKLEKDLRKTSLIMIDCDLYTSTKEALKFCADLIQEQAIIFFDDWQPRARFSKGEKRAFDEFLNEFPEFFAETFGEYSYKPGDLHGKIFRIARRGS